MRPSFQKASTVPTATITTCAKENHAPRQLPVSVAVKNNRYAQMSKTAVAANNTCFLIARELSLLEVISCLEAFCAIATS
ncbi:MAG: hypothetical protein WCN89_04600 [bacterium]